LAREQTVESKKKQFKDLDTKPRLQRIPLALGVSLLYAFMTSPALFALRGTVKAGSVFEKIQVFSTGVSVFGMILEAVADQHKYEVKRQSKDGDFAGPTTWSYKICRHPNYLGEILFWVGLFGAGSVSFGKSIVAWVGSVLGLSGILSIMLGASARLDKKQEEKYGGQASYDEWKKGVSYSVLPLLK
jgi:steroid 5-alpha reductase family enzyme